MKKSPKSPIRSLCLIAAVLIVAIVGPAQAEKEPARRSTFPKILGIALVAVGSVYAAYHLDQAREMHDTYEKSAFTTNTDALRKDVESHNVRFVVGSVIAGAGAVTILVSF